jgi:tetratricopeptide (TPR) repeat protein
MAFAGVVALGHVGQGVTSVVDAYKKTLELFTPQTCDGLPIAQFREVIWRNIKSGGEHYRAGRERAQKLLECSKEDYDALNALGAIEFYSGNYVPAEQYFKRALKTKPDSRSLHLNLADTLVELGRYEPALEDYRAFDDGSDAISYKIGRTQLLAGNYREARRVLARISSDFGEEAKPGKARILEAAAMVGQAREETGPAREQLVGGARQKFLEGVNRERSWWVELLSGRSANRYEPFTKVSALLQEKLPEWLAAQQ